ncbi:hypothetical protein H5410_014043 [Solanum commersonii]|uniref:Uncharacterized protein n=1 Tax=Solanum commersonii TaxID=4109 RepID=A0A9J5ZQ36_SOLCO|nr:hypothetical protein H5410_014043 [Solanum commersonii]
MIEAAWRKASPRAMPSATSNCNSVIEHNKFWSSIVATATRTTGPRTNPCRAMLLLSSCLFFELPTPSQQGVYFTNFGSTVRFSGIFPLKLFPERSRVIKLDKLESDAGMFPERWFVSSTTDVRDEQLEITSGISPVRVFLPKSNTLKRERRARSEGIWPLNEFDLRFKIFRAVLLPKSGDRFKNCKPIKLLKPSGTFPDRLFSCKAITCKLGKPPRTDGNSPDKFCPLKSRATSLYKVPMLDGIVPEKPFLLRFRTDNC